MLISSDYEPEFKSHLPASYLSPPTVSLPFVSPSALPPPDWAEVFSKGSYGHMFLLAWSEACLAPPCARMDDRRAIRRQCDALVSACGRISVEGTSGVGSAPGHPGPAPIWGAQHPSGELQRLLEHGGHAPCKTAPCGDRTHDRTLMKRMPCQLG